MEAPIKAPGVSRGIGRTFGVDRMHDPIAYAPGLYGSSHKSPRREPGDMGRELASLPLLG
jgi:hypothetical protein